jgi:hypothetical protein
MRVCLLTLPLAIFGLVACGSNDAPDASEAANRGTTRRAIDKSIRDDLRLAFTIGARCGLRDQDCRAAVAEEVKAGRDDARIATLVAGLTHEEICRQLTSVREPNVAFAVGAGNIGPNGEEGAVVLDLKLGTGTVLTAASGLSAVYAGGAWEAITGSQSPMLDAWAGALSTREASIPIAGANVHFATDAGLLGAAMPGSSAAIVKGFVSIDGSTFGYSLRPSASSALGMTKALGPIVKKEGASFTFIGDSTIPARVALAATAVQLAGFKGLAPRAAAIAIGSEEGSLFEGGIGAYCSSDALTVRSFGVKPLGGSGSGTSLDDGFAGIETPSSEETAAFDCSSQDGDLACEGGDFCARSGEKTSCCRAPITDPEVVSKMQGCTQGPNDGCPAGTACSQAGPIGSGTESSFVCVPTSECSGFKGTAEGLPKTDRVKRKCDYFEGDGTSVINQAGAVVEGHEEAVKKCIEFRKNNNGATDNEAMQFCKWSTYAGDDYIADCSASVRWQSRCKVKIDRCLFSARMEQPSGYGRNQ